MNQVMAWNQIKKAYPSEWVAITHFNIKEAIPYGDIEGEVIAHHGDETIFTQILKKMDVGADVIDIRFTGEILPDHPIAPVLWQISTTNS